MTMTFEEFKRLIETDFGPADGGILGELVDTVENMVAGGSDLSSAITNAAQEMRDTLADIQSLGSEDLDDEDTDEFDETLDEEAGGDDCCDNCLTSGVDCSQTCPDCGAVLCADCAAENEGLCAKCTGAAEEEEAEENDDENDEASHED
jgi:hypothetical protein